MYCKYFSCVIYSSQSKIPVWPSRPRTFPNGRKTSNRVYFGVKNILGVGTLKHSISVYYVYYYLLFCRTVRICSLSHAFILILFLIEYCSILFITSNIGRSISRTDRGEEEKTKWKPTYKFLKIWYILGLCEAY